VAAPRAVRGPSKGSTDTVLSAAQDESYRGWRRIASVEKRLLGYAACGRRRSRDASFVFFDYSGQGLIEANTGGGGDVTSTVEQHTVLPPSVAEPDARQELRRLDEFITLAASPAHQAKLVSPDGSEVALPDRVYEVLRDVVKAMSQGFAINIAPLNAVLTTQQAADMLNISRPTLVKLLESGEIPFEKPGRHRRVLLSDLLEYRARSRAERQGILDELTATANRDGSDDIVDGFIQTR
jgi:excisionase family DNA binding protein